MVHAAQIADVITPSVIITSTGIAALITDDVASSTIIATSADVTAPTVNYTRPTATLFITMLTSDTTTMAYLL
jgi:hypothetical protein